MAQKRMFDYGIIDNDNFGDLPVTTKCLYFLLGMNTDSYGFVSFTKISKLYGFEKDDMKVLIAKGFAIQFESGIIVMTNFNQNNYLDKNRITPTIYQKELKQLRLTKERLYVLNICLTDVKPVELSGEEKIEKIPSKNEEGENANPQKNEREEENKRNVEAIKKEIQKINQSFGKVAREDLPIIQLEVPQELPMAL